MARKLFCQLSPFCYRISVEKEIMLRNLRDLISPVRFAEHREEEPLPALIKGHRSPMLRQLAGVDMQLGQFTRNYTQTTKRGLLTTKQAEHQAQESARCSACFVVRGFQRGLPLGTRLCLQSVVCYTLCRRCRENAVAAGEGKGV